MAEVVRSGFVILHTFFKKFKKSTFKLKAIPQSTSTVTYIFKSVCGQYDTGCNLEFDRILTLLFFGRNSGGQNSTELQQLKHRLTNNFPFRNGQ